MSEKDYIFSGKVKQKGIFDYKELYRFCYAWLVEKEYLVVEKEYTEKINPNGKEVVIEWEAKRKISDYFRFIIKAKWRILGMKEAEVVKDGDKITIEKGDVEIKVDAIVEKDYEHRWEGAMFFKFLRSLYDRYIIRARIDEYQTRIYQEVNEYLSQIKSFLALEGNTNFVS